MVPYKFVICCSTFFLATFTLLLVTEFGKLISSKNFICLNQDISTNVANKISLSRLLTFLMITKEEVRLQYNPTLIMIGPKEILNISLIGPMTSHKLFFIPICLQP